MQDSAPDPVSGLSSLPSRIATLVHAHFNGLPERSKPVIRDDGTAEWIPMTGIVLVRGENTASETLNCIAVTTGAKCLPASQIPHCSGLVLHDCHAEILAMRAFNFWLLSECHSVLAHEQLSPRDKDTPISPYIRRRHQLGESSAEKPAIVPPFELQPDVKIYMYCTCAPCGDASMELCMAAQDDPTPWAIKPSEDETCKGGTTANSQLLDGRAHFSRLGIVRRKPARADAESTKSKSCSDKIAIRQVSSLLNYETSLLVAPTENAYIAGLILPEEEITQVGCARSFGENGRMRALRGRIWPLGTVPADEVGTGPAGHTNAGNQFENRPRYEFHPFQILSIPNAQLKSLWPFRKPKTSDDSPFPEGQSQPQSTATKKSKPGNLSAVWISAPTTTTLCSVDPDFPMLADNGSKTLRVLRGSKTGLFESIINGVRQGHKASSPGARGASALSRARLWSYFRYVAATVHSSEESGTVTEGGHVDGGRTVVSAAVFQASTYHDFKEPAVLTEAIRARKSAIRSAKEVLDGWVPNSGDEDWGLDVLIDSKKRKR